MATFMVRETMRIKLTARQETCTLERVVEANFLIPASECQLLAWLRLCDRYGNAASLIVESTPPLRLVVLMRVYDDGEDDHMTPV
jgi:hypothetical protein